MHPGALSDGPFAVVTDVHSGKSNSKRSNNDKSILIISNGLEGTVCSLDEAIHGEPPVPPECECTFHRLSENIFEKDSNNSLKLYQSSERSAVLRSRSQVPMKQQSEPWRRPNSISEDCCKQDGGIQLAQILLAQHCSEELAENILKAVSREHLAQGQQTCLHISHFQFMEYTEVFYARQPGVAQLGIPKTLVAPRPQSAQPSRTEDQAARVEQQHKQQQQQLLPLAPTAAAIAPPAKASYPLTRLPSEEELAASLANHGGGG
ncbi:hypothetical protein Esti_003455 [Eimeria stiedai]